MILEVKRLNILKVKVEIDGKILYVTHDLDTKKTDIFQDEICRTRAYLWHCHEVQIVEWIEAYAEKAENAA